MEPIEHTYDDAGRLCGVSAETIRHRAKRGKLMRGRPTNTGRPTVILSLEDISAISAGRPTALQPGGQTGGATPGQAKEETSTIKAVLAVVEQSNALRLALEGEAGALREALSRERARVDQLTAELGTERVLRGKAADDLDNAQATLVRLRGRGLLARLLNQDARE